MNREQLVGPELLFCYQPALRQELMRLPMMEYNHTCKRPTDNKKAGEN